MFLIVKEKCIFLGINISVGENGNGGFEDWWKLRYGGCVECRGC